MDYTSHKQLFDLIKVKDTKTPGPFSIGTLTLGDDDEELGDNDEELGEDERTDIDD